MVEIQILVFNVCGCLSGIPDKSVQDKSISHTYSITYAPCKTCRIWLKTSTPWGRFVFPVAGEPGLSCERGHQSEPVGAQPAHVWGGPAADLHAHAPGLLPPLPQLLRLPEPSREQERLLPGHLKKMDLPPFATHQAPPVTFYEYDTNKQKQTQTQTQGATMGILKKVCVTFFS